jgi:uncharacterized protein DUF6527
MPKTETLTAEYCDTIPKELAEGIIYISLEFKVAIHLCACGCRQKTVTPINRSNSWQLSDVDGKITLRPSIGNFMGENPYHAHYYITQNKIEWL